VARGDACSAEDDIRATAISAARERIAAGTARNHLGTARAPRPSNGATSGSATTRAFRP